MCVKDREGSHLCTVRYHGVIADKQGTWVGVEWDDPARGKNDGTVNGTRYFQCRHSSNGGSFIRSDKVKAGVSLADAVQQRYTLAEQDLNDMSIQTASKRTMAVNLSGMDKVSKHLQNLSSLPTMTMHGLSIARAVRSTFHGSLTAVTSCADPVVPRQRQQLHCAAAPGGTGWCCSLASETNKLRTYPQQMHRPMAVCAASLSAQ